MKKIQLLILVFLGTLSMNSQNINKIEYWVDIDPGIGMALPLTGFTPQPIVANFTSSIAALNSGSHTIGFRSKDSNGKWSHANFIQVLVSEPTVAGDMISLEYFWDIDAGFGNNSIVNLTPATSNFDGQFSAAVPGLLTEGQHILFIRTRDSQNRYSHTNYRINIYVDNPLGTTDLEKAGIRIYPNPIEDHLNIAIEDNGKSRLIIYDLNGKQIIDTVVDKTATIDMSTLSSGVYIAYFWKDQNKIYTTKLIKR